MSNVVKLNPIKADENPDTVVEQAFSEYESLCYMGYTRGGVLHTKATANLTDAELLLMLEKLKLSITMGLHHD